MRLIKPILGSIKDKDKFRTLLAVDVGGMLPDTADRSSVMLVLTCSRPTENSSLGNAMELPVNKPCPKLGIYVDLQDSMGRVLLLKRSPTSRSWPGLWELPGGKPEVNESVQETARRELEEETGLQTTADRFADHVRTVDESEGLRLLILQAQASTRAVRLSAEHSEFRWVELKQIDRLPLRPGMAIYFRRYVPLPSRETAAGTKGPASTG